MAKLTPRTQYVLVCCLEVLASQYGDEVEDLGQADLTPTNASQYNFGSLPISTWKLGQAWRENHLENIQELQQRVSETGGATPYNTAQEIILWEALSDAMTATVEGVWEEVLGSLPAHGDDYLWVELRESLYQDQDFRLLFDPRHDGIENDKALAKLGFANLHPRDWFQTFANIHQEEQESLSEVEDFDLTV
jgi:hypothetical protein